MDVTVFFEIKFKLWYKRQAEVGKPTCVTLGGAYPQTFVLDLLVVTIHTSHEEHSNESLYERVEVVCRSGITLLRQMDI